MTERETLCAMALSRTPRVTLPALRLVMERMGSAEAVYERRGSLREALPEASPKLIETLSTIGQRMARAEEELAFAQRGGVRCLGLADEDYPARLRECPDAPLVLYHKGAADLNAARMVGVVGTRQMTEYGRDACEAFVRDLCAACPDTVIVSGLAYGVDICAHRAALDAGAATVAVLAHGLDTIYPRIHRDTAVRMLERGGLLTEFMSRTNADKRNFVQRNRIVAGLCDAVVVVESARKGGALITAEIANGYHREVMAYPGRAYDERSAGCNELIRTDGARLLTSAEDFMQSMGWESAGARKKRLAGGVQQELFAELSDEERKIVAALAKSDGKQVNALTVETGIPVGALSSHLFEMEMRGLVRMMSGGVYRLPR